MIKYIPVKAGSRYTSLLIGYFQRVNSPAFRPLLKGWKRWIRKIKPS